MSIFESKFKMLFIPNYTSIYLSHVHDVTNIFSLVNNILNADCRQKRICTFNLEKKVKIIKKWRYVVSSDRDDINANYLHYEKCMIQKF